MKYNEQEITAIRKFIGDIKVADLMESKELLEALVSVLSKKLGTEIEPSEEEIDVLERIDTAMKFAAKSCSITKDELVKKQRKKECVYGRRIFIYYLYYHLGLSDNEIGKQLDQNRSTIISSRRKINDDYYYSPEFKLYMNRFCAHMKIEFTTITKFK